MHVDAEKTRDPREGGCSRAGRPMSPLKMGRAKVKAVPAAEVGERTSALSMALLTGAAELEPLAVDRARRVVDKAVERGGITGDHTVVALAGATGSGKSSLFNALVGADVATIGARRPTTSLPTAAIWGDADASELLDWLAVDTRHVVEASAAPDGAAAEGGSASARCRRAVGALDGLVLLDLPDFDSREVAHRVEAERILELVDVFVWVTDPQKYADARLHDDFVSILSRHGAVTLAVLNQSDRLSRGRGQGGRQRPRRPPRVRRSQQGDGAAHLDGDGRGHRQAAPAPRQCRCRTCGLTSATALRPRRRGLRPAARRRRQPSPTPPRSTAARSTPPSPGRPACRSSSTPWRATTAARPSPTPAGSSPAGPRASPPTRCDGCASTAPVGVRRSRSRSRAPTCVRCSAGRRSRRPPRRRSRRSTSRPAPSCATPRRACRCGGSSPSRMPSTGETVRWPTPSTRPC